MPSFAICPLVRVPLETTGIGSLRTSDNASFKAVVTQDQLQITTSQAGRVRVLDLAGKTIKSLTVKAGMTSLPINQLNRGLYIVEGPRGESCKVIF